MKFSLYFRPLSVPGERFILFAFFGLILIIKVHHFGRIGPRFRHPAETPEFSGKEIIQTTAIGKRGGSGRKSGSVPPFLS